MAIIKWLWLVCLAVVQLTAVSANKRLVLHSDIDVSSAFGTVDKNLTELDKRILQVEYRIGQLETENKLLSTVNLQLTTENRNLGDKVNRLENRTHELTAQLSKFDIQNAIRILDQNLTQFKQNVHQMQSRIEQLESENTRQAAENKLLATVNQQLTTDNRNLGTDFAQLKNRTQQLSAHLANVDNQNGGSTFVRWGRSVCPGNGTDRVYKGYIGGTLYSKSGGSNSLCLTADPTWNKNTDGVNDNGLDSFIYGTEIDIDASFSTKLFGYDINNQDPSCASCHTSREAVAMIPGRYNCYPGWTMEYTGYLVGGRLGQASTDYICLDSKPEALPRGQSNDDQHILYVTEARCGSLPCPPYHDGRELACVVCSK